MESGYFSTIRETGRSSLVLTVIVLGLLGIVYFSMVLL
jgi:hypothetical protein